MRKPDIAAALVTTLMMALAGAGCARKDTALAPEKLAVFSYIRKRLEQGTTFVNALKAMTQSRQTEADEIKAMLSAKQRQLFDQTYGADGLGLFSYALIANFGK